MNKYKRIFPVEYKIVVWNEIKEKHEELHGITFADTYPEAMENIASYYGEDNIVDIRLFMTEETTIPVYEFENCVDSDFHGMIKIEKNSISEWE